MSYASLVSFRRSGRLSHHVIHNLKSKALLPKALRNKKKHERPSIASIVEPSVSAAALFASATLIPSPSSYIFSQPPSPSTEEEYTFTGTQGKRTLRRVKARIELRANATGEMERTATTTSTATASSGSSHVPSTHASPNPSPFTSTNSPAWDGEDQTPGFGELFRRFSMQEAEESHTLSTSTERN